MRSLLQVVLFLASAVYTSAHDQQQLPPSIPVGLQPQQAAQHAPSPQVYIGQGPTDFGTNGAPSTTVCVEIRSNPAYKICGPEISPQQSGPHQQYPQQAFYQNQQTFPYTKQDVNKDNLPQAQPLPSEQKPVIANQRGGMLIQRPMELQQLFRSPVMMPPQPNLLIAKQYIPPPHPNTISTDGSLSMNCKVSGVKYPSFPSGGFNNMAYRYVQQPFAMMPQGIPFVMKTNEMNLMPLDGTSSGMPGTLPGMPGTPPNGWMPFNMNGRSEEEGMDPHNGPVIPKMMYTEPNEPVTTNPAEVAEDNRKRLTELKQQIAELNKIAMERQQHDASGAQPQNPNTPTQNLQPPQSNEQKPMKNMSQQQPQAPKSMMEKGKLRQ